MLKALTLISALLFATIALAEGTGTSVGGGGQTVDVGGKPTLRDLVEKTVCAEHVSGDDLASELPHFAKIMTAIESVQYYFASSIKNELPNLTVCFTKGNLKQIQTEDQDGLTIYTENDSTKQVAIRLDNMVYIDQKIFRAMDKQSQAYLLLHEVSHSFIPMDVTRRNSKLRNLIASIHTNEKNPMSKKRFKLQLIANDVMPDFFNSSELFRAVLLQDYEKVKVALQHGADVNRRSAYTDNHGYLSTQGGSMTPLFLATMFNNLGIVELLLSEEELNPNIQMDGFTTDKIHMTESPLSYAARHGYVDVTIALLQGSSKTDVNQISNYQPKESPMTPLLAAAQSGQSDVVALLMVHPDIDINAVDTNGDSALCHAVKNADAATVERLMNHPRIDTQIICSSANPATWNTRSYFVKTGYQSPDWWWMRCARQDAPAGVALNQAQFILDWISNVKYRLDHRPTLKQMETIVTNLSTLHEPGENLACGYFDYFKSKGIDNFEKYYPAYSHIVKLLSRK